jgi:hypothetical protein
VRRLIAAVYQQIEVVFTGEKCDPPLREIHIVTDLPPYRDDGVLRVEARNTLIDVLKEQTLTSGLSMCAVFGEQDTVYVNPDGQLNYRTEAPSGGLNL